MVDEARASAPAGAEPRGGGAGSEAAYEDRTHAGGVDGRAQTQSAACEAAAAPDAEDSLSARAALLVAQLGAEEASLRLDAVTAVTKLCAGDSDARSQAAACAALVSHGAVHALLRLSGVLDWSVTDADAGVRERCACAALAALAALTDAHAPARAAVAAANPGFSILAAAIRYARDDDVVKHAAHVVRNLAIEDALEEALCAGAPHLLRSLIDILSESAHVHRSTVLAALDSVSMLCFTSLANKMAVLQAGGVAALVGVLRACQLEDSTGVDAEDEELCDLCATGLCNLAADSPRQLPEAIRACGGIDALLWLAKSDLKGDSDCVLSAVRALAALASCDSLHVALVDAHALDVITPVVRNTSRPETRLAGLLLVAYAYSSAADAAADSLLLEYDIASHLREMLLAVMPGKDCVYLSTTWSRRGACMLARMASVHGARALNLVEHEVPALLLQLLAATHDDAATQHCICRALLNFTYEPALLAGLRAVATDAIVTLRGCAATSTGTQAADAVNGVLLALGELHQEAANKAATATAELSADVKAGYIASGSGGAGKQTPQFQVFLSHRRNDAKDFARGLYNKFQLRGFTCFLDFEFREELNDLAAIVGACDNFVFILTEHVFDSTWCMVELRAAVLSGVNIVLVRKDGALWEDEQGVRCVEHPPLWFINEQDEAVRSTLISNKAVLHSDEYYDPFCEALVDRLLSPEKAAERRAIAQAARQQHAGAQPSTPATPARGPPLGSGGSGGSGAAHQAATMFSPQSGGGGSLTMHRSNSSVRGALAGNAMLEQLLRSELQPVHTALAEVHGELAELRRERTLMTASAPAAVPPQGALGPKALLEQLRAELQPVHAALASIRHELTELRCSQASAALMPHAGVHGAAQQALALLPAWVSAAGVTCCAAMALVAVHTMRSSPRS